MTWTTGPRSVEVEIRYADASDPGGGSARAGRLAPSERRGRRIATNTTGDWNRNRRGGGEVARAERVGGVPARGSRRGGRRRVDFRAEPSRIPGAGVRLRGRGGRRTRRARDSAVVVSSALAACERPPAPVWIHDDSSRVVGVEFASTLESAARASRDGATVAAWPSSTATYRVTPSAVSSAGGTVVSLSGRGYPPSRGGTTCRFGSVGPVAGTRTVAGDVECVSPALAPGRDARVFGPEGRIDPSEAHRAATTIRILDENNASEDEARGRRRRRGRERRRRDRGEGARHPRVPRLPGRVAAQKRSRPPAGVRRPFGGRSRRPPDVHPRARGRDGDRLRKPPRSRRRTTRPCRVGSAPSSCWVDARATTTTPSSASRPIARRARRAWAFSARWATLRSSTSRRSSSRSTRPRSSGRTRPRPRPPSNPNPNPNRTFAASRLGTSSRDHPRRNARRSSVRISSLAPRRVGACSGMASPRSRVASPPRWCRATLSPTIGASSVAAATTRRAFRRGVDLRTTAELSASARAPCAPGAAVGCATVMYHPTVPETRDASPSTVGEGGGDAVTVAGSGFPDVDGDGCRLGSLGPVLARYVSASSVTCVTPARAPAAAVRVAAYGAWSDDARVAFVAENVAPTFASPPVARRVGGPRVRAFGFARAGDDAECRLGGAEGGTFAVAKTIAASIAWWSCDAPTNRAGDAFQTLFVGVVVVVVGGGGGGGGAAKPSSPPSSPPSIFSSSFVIEYAEDPLVASAWPVSASISGGSIVHVVAARGGGGFTTGADGASRGATCAFGSTATRAAASSSATARCEVPPSTPGVRALSVTREGDGASLGETGFASGSNVAVRARPPLRRARRDAGRRRLVPSTTLTIIGRGFAPEAISLACRVGTVGPLATTWISTAEVRCVAPAHSGRALERRARVAVLASISDVIPATPNPPPTVRFDVDATRLDPRGTPGGRRRGEFEEHPADENWAIREVASATREIARRGDARGDRRGDAPSPIFVVGDGFPARSVSEGCRCVFGDDADARATDIIAVSSRLLACRDAPTAARHAGGGIVATTVRVACGVVAAKSASGDSDLASSGASAASGPRLGRFRPRLGRFQPRLFLLLRLLGVPRDDSCRVAAFAARDSTRARSLAGRRDDVTGRTRVPARIKPRGVDADVSIRYRRSRRVASRRERRDAMRQPRVGGRATPRVSRRRRRRERRVDVGNVDVDVDVAAFVVVFVSRVRVLGRDASRVARRARRGRGCRGASGRNRGGRRAIRTVPRRRPRRVGSRPRCAFGASSADTVAGSWIVRGRDATTNGDDSVGEVRVTVDVRDGRCRVRRRRRRHRERRPRRRRRAVPNPPRGARSRRVSARELGPGGDARARVEPRRRRRRSRPTRRVRLRGSNGPRARRLVGDHDVRSRRGVVPPGAGDTTAGGENTNRGRGRGGVRGGRARDDGVRARRRGV